MLSPRGRRRPPIGAGTERTGMSFGLICGREQLLMSQGTLSTPHPADASQSTEASILVVDDSPMDRTLVGNLVEQGLGWRVRYASNGTEALASLAQSSPNLVLADLQMPQMNGLELVKAMRDLYPL